jgi:hypothetical protein
MKREFRNGRECIVWDSLQDWLDHFEMFYGDLQEPGKSLLKKAFESTKEEV